MIPQTHSIQFAVRASDSTIPIAKNSQFFHLDVCQEHLLTKDVKYTTKHPASANPPMPNQAVISGEKAFIKFQLLKGVGPYKLDWPRRDDIDEVHISCI